MKMSTFQKIALFCTLSLIVLIFMGAIVRATGSGMGCPDWPKCWGQYIPPTSVDEIDVSKIDIEKYKQKRERHGGNPDDITIETVLDEFDPLETWIEYINRLTSMPIGLGSLVLLGYAQVFIGKKRLGLLLFSYASVLLVLINAVMGARIVYTGLSPGVITTHMALAMLLLCILVYLTWAGGDKRKRIDFHKAQTVVLWTGWVLFILIVIEGVMGSQVRELTDEMQKSHQNEPRSEWTGELENTFVYLAHRSFSWLILLAAILFGYFNVKYTKRRWTWVELTVVGIVFAQMVLGLVLAQVGVLPVIQVLHIGLSSILIAALYYWLLCAGKAKKQLSS